MRVLILSDLHANWEALQALQRAEPEPDALFFLGDIVNYGPDPKQCLDWLRANASAIVRGNNDHGVAHGGAQGVDPSLGNAYADMVPYTRSQLSDDDLRWLGALPLQKRVELGGTAFHLVHASPQEPLSKRFHPLLMAEETLERELEGVDADAVLVGHTHMPCLRKLGSAIIVNPGSLGQPRHGTPLGTYAVWLDGELAIRHLRSASPVTGRKLARLPLDPELIDSLQTILARGAL
jgi:putative phosphoesterase